MEVILTIDIGTSSVKVAIINLREFCSWFPISHWTDQKIKAHAFYCVLALLFSSLLYQKARKSRYQYQSDGVDRKTERNLSGGSYLSFFR